MPRQKTDLKKSYPEAHQAIKLKLFEAARSGNVVLAAYARGQGVDINSRDKQGRTALALAALHGKIDLVKLLLKNGAKTEIADHLGDTPLISAAGAGHLEVVKCLLQAGANGNAGADNCRTPLLLACENGHAELVTYLLKYPVLRYPGVQQGRGPWVRCLQNTHVNVARALLAQNCDINETDTDGNNVLMMAIKMRNADLVRQIISSKSINIDYRNKSGQTARQLAENLGDKVIIQLLKRY